MGFRSRKKRLDPKSEEQALFYVKNLLRYRLRSVEEVRRRLLQKGFEEDVVSAVVEKLKNTGILDDRRFAYLFALSELRVSFHGPYVIRRKLRELGVEEELIDEAVDKAMEEFDLREAVVRLLEKFKDVRKLRDYLFKRGFDPSILDNLDLDIDRR